MKSICLLIMIFSATGLNAQKWEKNYDFVDDCICGLSKVSKNGKIGYADKQGKEVIPLLYSEGLTFNEGMVAVKKEGKWMYLDSTGKAITEGVFDDASSFDSGLAVVAKGGLYGYINKTGEVVITLLFSNARSFTEGLAPAASLKGNWGFIDKKGDWIIKAQYGFVDNFANNEARVMKGDKVFYIDKADKVLHE